MNFDPFVIFQNDHGPGIGRTGSVAPSDDSQTLATLLALFLVTFLHNLILSSRLQWHHPAETVGRTNVGHMSDMVGHRENGGKNQKFELRIETFYSISL